MPQPIEISEDYLFAKIGRLVVENELLRAKQAQAEANEPEKDQEPDGR
jgi:hypothetical protein